MSSTAGDERARVGVVVVNYGAHALLEQNLPPLVAAGVTVVVVDNFHSDAERAAVTQVASTSGWDLQPMRGNLGFGSASNVGVARARELGCDVFVLLNPDVALRPEVLGELVAQVRREPMTLVSPRIVMPDGTVWFRGGALDLDTGRTRSRVELPRAEGSIRPWLTGACLVVHDELWSKVGGFDEDYFLYWEDVDLSYRVQAVGGQLGVRDDLTCVHSVGATQHGNGSGGGTPSGEPKSNVYYYWNCRNRLVFAARHLSRRRVVRWLLTEPSYVKSVLLRGGRRQLLRSPKPAIAAVRGLLAGTAIALRALPTKRERPGRIRYPRVRIYQTIRTAHLEAAHAMVPATILYGSRRYDFDPKFVAGLDVVQVSIGRLVRTLLRAPIHTVEINEPLMRQSHKRTALAVTAIGLRNLLRRRKIRIVTYAIENLDYAFPGVHGVRRRLLVLRDRLFTHIIARGVDQIAFGTNDSLELYRRRLPSLLERADHVLVWGLPAPCDCAVQERDPNLIVFVGALDQRKGFVQLKAAWPHVIASSPDAKLEVLGKGPLADAAHEFAATAENVEFVHDPDRATIHHTLRRASVLVLLSQVTPTWREQIGRPLLEGLQHGCAVLATTETAIAPWLAEHRHAVVAPDASSGEVAVSIIRLLHEQRPAADVLADLPAVDGRIEADRWLMRPPVGSHEHA